tara:strand:+ start:74 stop:451 length:378 start_codon:yes stop_codon:yes gene_type:complete
MSITTSYSWHVCRLITKSTPNNYTVKAIDGYIYAIDSNGVNNTHKFILPLDIPESYSSGEFTEFDDLTESQVSGWITSKLSDNQQQILKDKVSEKLKIFYNESGELGFRTDYKPAVPWTVGFTTT